MTDCCRRRYIGDVFSGLERERIAARWVAATDQCRKWSPSVLAREVESAIANHSVLLNRDKTSAAPDNWRITLTR